jgi:exonuclease SbcD
MMFKILHFADLHLDAAFSGLLPDDAGRRRRRALRETLTNIAALAGQADVDAVFCAGDLFEQERVSPDTVAFLRETFTRLQPLPIYVAPGNHDWYGRGTVYAQTDWSANVTIFKNPRPEAVVLRDGLTLWGAAHCAPANTDNFFERFTADRSGVSIGLFHASECTWLHVQSQGKEPHAAFAPDDIRRAGLTYAFLGHFHTPRSAPTYSYPGNPCPLAFGETGDRGAIVATVEDDGSVAIERHRVAATNVLDLTVDVDGCASGDDVRRRVLDAVRGLSGSARINLTGALEREVELHPRDLVDAARNLDGVSFRLEGLSVAYDWDLLAGEQTVRGEFVREVRGAGLPAEEARRVLVMGLRALEGRTDLEVV